MVFKYLNNKSHRNNTQEYSITSSEYFIFLQILKYLLFLGSY